LISAAIPQEIEFPPGAERAAERLSTWAPRSRAHAARWLGIEPAGAPRYVLVEDYAGMRRKGSPAAPEWAVAIARPDDVMVFRLDLVDRQPSSRLELVADHEIVHQLLNHLGGERLPRWFEEGLCTSYAGVPFLEPPSSLELTAAAGSLPRFSETRLLFHGGAGDAGLAYEVGERAVRYLLATPCARSWSGCPRASRSRRPSGSGRACRWRPSRSASAST